MKKVNTNGIRVNLKNVGPNFCKYISICLKVSFTALRNVALILPMKDWYLKINENNQNYLKTMTQPFKLLPITIMYF